MPPNWVWCIFGGPNDPWDTEVVVLPSYGPGRNRQQPIRRDLQERIGRELQGPFIQRCRGRHQIWMRADAVGRGVFPMFSAVKVAMQAARVDAVAGSEPERERVARCRA